MRAAAALVLFLSALPALRLSAQSRPALYRDGKWVASALAIGFTAVGVSAHNDANRSFNALLDICRASSCALGPEGRYVDPAAEAKYEHVVNKDRAARVWLVAGQAALAGAIGLFILDLHHGGSEPHNIPYSGLIFAPAPAPPALGGGMRLNVGWKVKL